MEEWDVVIVGAGPAGLSAAIFTQLDGWSTLVLEGRWVGGQGAIAWTVSNYPGFPPGDGAMLMGNLERQVTSAPPAGVGAKLRMESVLSINPEERAVISDKNQYKAKAIILATGGTMQRLGIPGEDRFVNRGVSYCAKQDYEKFAGKKVLVVGGGNTTAKSALVAKGVSGDVTVVHRRAPLRAYPSMVKRLQKEGVKIWYDAEVKEIRGDDMVRSAVVTNNKTREEAEVPVDWVVVCVGTEPNTALARAAGLEMAGDLVKIDRRMMTSKPPVFACGEITGCDKHIVPVASEGATAGMAASQYLALEKVKRGETFDTAVCGKYADEYKAMLC